MITLSSPEEVKARVGGELGVSGWHQVTQAAVDQFAELTGDDQFIHIDQVRARTTSFGTTVAHGLYTLSLGAGLSREIFELRGCERTLNYGLNRVRFPAPVRVGARVRMRAALLDATDIPGGVRVVIEQTFMAENEVKPVCVAETVLCLYFG